MTISVNLEGKKVYEKTISSQELLGVLFLMAITLPVAPGFKEIINNAVRL